MKICGTTHLTRVHHTGALGHAHGQSPRTKRSDRASGQDLQVGRHPICTAAKKASTEGTGRERRACLPIARCETAKTERSATCLGARAGAQIEKQTAAIYHVVRVKVLTGYRSDGVLLIVIAFQNSVLSPVPRPLISSPGRASAADVPPTRRGLPAKSARPCRASN